jgi:hypothetical protein
VDANELLEFSPIHIFVFHHMHVFENLSGRTPRFVGIR